MSDNVCSNQDCPTKGHHQKAMYLVSVIIKEQHKGKQKPFTVKLCFDCYYNHLRDNEENNLIKINHPKSDYK